MKLPSNFDLIICSSAVFTAILITSSTKVLSSDTDSTTSTDHVTDITDTDSNAIVSNYFNTDIDINIHIGSDTDDNNYSASGSYIMLYTIHSDTLLKCFCHSRIIFLVH